MVFHTPTPQVVVNFEVDKPLKYLMLLSLRTTQKMDAEIVFQIFLMGLPTVLENQRSTVSLGNRSTNYTN